MYFASPRKNGGHRALADILESIDELRYYRAALPGIVPGADGPLLYARVDLIPDDEGNPVVLEVELTEPSLFFAHAEGSAQRFADAVAARL